MCCPCGLICGNHKQQLQQFQNYLLPLQRQLLLQLQLLILLRVLCVQAGVQVRATEQHATDERFTQTQRQHRVCHVDEHNATGAAIKRFAAKMSDT